MLQRTITAICLILALLALLYLGGWFFAVGAAIAIALTVYEELRALKAAGHRPVWWASFAGLAVSVPTVMLVDTPSMSLIIAILVALGFAVVLQVMLRPAPDLIDILVSVMPMLTLVLPGMCLFGLLRVPDLPMQKLLLSSVFAIAVVCDTFAYLVGSTLGGRKLCPLISPKKTVSGAIGGMVGAMLGAVAVMLGFQLAFPSAAYPSVWYHLALGLVGGVAAQMGDLFASLVKRHCGVKDFGNLFPGHGGMLDRMDSILFVAILVYCYHLLPIF